MSKFVFISQILAVALLGMVTFLFGHSAYGSQEILPAIVSLIFLWTTLFCVKQMVEQQMIIRKMKTWREK